MVWGVVILSFIWLSFIFPYIIFSFKKRSLIHVSEPSHQSIIESYKIRLDFTSLIRKNSILPNACRFIGLNFQISLNFILLLITQLVWTYLNYQ